MYVSRTYKAREKVGPRSKGRFFVCLGGHVPHRGEFNRWVAPAGRAVLRNYIHTTQTHIAPAINVCTCHPPLPGKTPLHQNRTAAKTGEKRKKHAVRIAPTCENTHSSPLYNTSTSRLELTWLSLTVAGGDEDPQAPKRKGRPPHRQEEPRLHQRQHARVPPAAQLQQLL